MGLEEREKILEIKKEVLSYLENKDLGVYYQHGSYAVEQLEIAKSKMPQENYYKHVFNNKLKLVFYREFFNAHEEIMNIFQHLYNKTSINNDYLLDNLNDLTEGLWKKDISKFLSKLTDKDTEKQTILLNINNSALSLNNKNLKQIYSIFQHIEQNKKIEFFINFFSKRKKFLSGNKGGSEIHKFLTEFFSMEEIKENFINVSPYIKDLFEKDVNLDIFNKQEKYQQVISFDPIIVEKNLKIPGFDKKKISFEIPKMINWLSSIMGYKNEIVTRTTTIKFILSSNDAIDEDLFKEVIKDYLLLVKNNQGKVLETEEIFAKWYSKNKLENKLIAKEVKIKPLKI